MKSKRYPWEIGTRLIHSIQARQFEASERTVCLLFDLVYGESRKNFQAVKERVVEMLGMGLRAAYFAGANPEKLFKINLEFIEHIIPLNKKKPLLKLLTSAIHQCVSLVPERDLFEMEKISAALAYIRANCTKGISRKKVAALIECSPSSLSRKFSKLTGRSYKSCVLEFRMEKAKKALLDLNRNITEVAFDMGYSDPNYFSACFKRVIGITPSQFRRTAPRTST